MKKPARSKGENGRIHYDRGSVARNGKNVYGTPRLPPSVGLRKKMSEMSKRFDYTLYSQGLLPFEFER